MGSDLYLNILLYLDPSHSGWVYPGIKIQKVVEHERIQPIVVNAVSIQSLRTKGLSRGTDNLRQISEITIRRVFNRWLLRGTSCATAAVYKQC